jgi:hypothetical protein
MMTMRMTMMKTSASTLLVMFLLCALLSARPARAHAGPPYPILVDQRVGPYLASLWGDPDIGTGTFFVVLEPLKGHRMPAWTRVRLGVQPVTKRLPEVFYDAVPQPVHFGGRYLALVQFDKGEMWRTHVVIEGAQGGGEMEAQAEATPDGIIGPFASLVYLVPFLGVGFLWFKAVLRRRGPVQPVAAPPAAT